MEGPKVPSRARRETLLQRRSADGVGSGKGRRSPSPVWESGQVFLVSLVWGLSPQKDFQKST